jgi:MraZ protein
VLQASGQETLVMRKDFFKPCLVLYPENVWNEQMDLLRSRLNRFNASHQRIFREYVSGTEVLTLDGNGRFLIPRAYMEECAIRQDVKFIGMGDTIEVWALEKMAEERMSSEEFGKALEEVMGTALPGSLS